MTKTQDSYSKSGVDYSKMDPIKVLAQQRARATAPQLHNFGMKEVRASRGESAYVWEAAKSYQALVIEGLGTKNLVADAVRRLSGKTHYDAIAQDAIAMVVNDLIVVGALPQVINAYFAIGSSDWLLDEERTRDLINGWYRACRLCGATWGGGETPTLKGIIDPKTIDLGGSAIGLVKNKRDLVLGDKLQAGDKIILVESSGIHANGITLIRELAKRRPKLYATKLKDGRSFGEALLTPSHLYVKLVKEMQQQRADIHYMVNITGHGWRKLMRATKSFTYRLSFTPPVHEEFDVIQRSAKLTDQEMYGNYNMGAGFAIMVPPKDVNKVLQAAAKVRLKAWEGGTVEKGPKQVIIEPKKITFKSDSLGVR